MSREWYPWFPHRFWTSERVALMDDAAVALYKFLLDHEWENGPFSSDERVLRAICSRFKSFDTSWPQVQPCFRKSRQGKYFNERMEQERELERQASHARAERTKNAWLKRRDAVERKSDADALHVQSKRRRRAKDAQSTLSATDRPTDRQTDVRTNAHTDGGAGGPAPGSEPPAPKRDLPFDWRPILAEIPEFDLPDVRDACSAFCEARRVKHGAWTEQGMRTALRKFIPLGAVALRLAFERATESPWMTIKTPDELQHDRNGSPKPGKRPDGTRPGEYPEPIVMPRRA